MHGVGMDWARLFKDPDAKRAPLPTYAFQRERFWMSAGPGVGDMVAAGQAPADHPLLGAVLALADDRGWVFTGRISLESHPWLADHAVMGTVLLPGTAFLELALHAGRELGCPAISELTLEAPLVLPLHGAVQIQVVVGEPEESGTRSLSIHSRLAGPPGEDGLAAGEWTRHAGGALASGGAVLNGRAGAIGERARALGDGAWPPQDAQAIDLDGLYDALAERGFEYGPVFQGLRAVWRRGEELFAEVALSPRQRDEAAGFGVHPALLDSAFHAGLSTLVSGDHNASDAPGGGARLPFSFNGVELHIAGASSLRVSLSPGEDGAISLLAADEDGGLVAFVDSLAVREISAEQLGSARDVHRDSLFRMDWGEIPLPAPDPSPPPEASSPDSSSPASDAAAEWMALGAVDSSLAGSLRAVGASVAVCADLQALSEILDGGGPLPETVLVDCCPNGIPGAGAASVVATVEGDELGEMALTHRNARQALSLVQSWLADERFSGSRLAFVTNGAVAASADESVPGLALSPLWGLVRSAQSENPERFILVNTDGEDASTIALPAALNTGEPQLAIRQGAVLTPRLARAESADHGRIDGGDLATFDPEDVILVTGGTGGLGVLVARHLVVEHGVGHLVLVSRRGEEAEGAVELREELEALGASVRIAACDVSDRGQLARLLDSISVGGASAARGGARRRRARRRRDRVAHGRAGRSRAGPKVDAAWHLHELTQHLDLSAFVLFSSGGGCARRPRAGQLCGGERVPGRPGGASSRARPRRRLDGMGTVGPGGRHEPAGSRGGSRADGALGDACARLRGGPRAVRRALGAGRGAACSRSPRSSRRCARRPRRGRCRRCSAVWSAPPRGEPAMRAGSLARRLAGMPEAERESVVLELVRAEVASVLGHASAGRDRYAAGLQGARVRLAGGRGAAQPAERGDRPAPARHARVRLSDPRGAGGLPAGRGVGRTGRAWRCPRCLVVALDEPIAIVGMSCRFPGGVRSPEELWELVAAGVDAISEFPTDRGWDLEGLYDPDPDHPGHELCARGRIHL